MKRESFPQDSPPVVNSPMYFAYVLARVSYKQYLNVCFVSMHDSNVELYLVSEWKIKKNAAQDKERHLCGSDIQQISTRVSRSWSPATVIILLHGNLGKTQTFYSRCQNIFTGLTGWCLHDRWQLFWHVLVKRLASNDESTTALRGK